MTFNNEMPRDPFEGDPDDPALLFEEDEQVPPLSDEDRATLQADLAFIEEYKQILQASHLKGVFFFCDDCEQPHFYNWDIMAANLRATLNGELAPVHEPGAEPNPDEYASWDYCVGFIDGIAARRRIIGS